MKQAVPSYYFDQASPTLEQAIINNAKEILRPGWGKEDFQHGPLLLLVYVVNILIRIGLSCSLLSNFFLHLRDLPRFPGPPNHGIILAQCGNKNPTVHAPPPRHARYLGHIFDKPPCQICHATFFFFPSSHTT